MHAHPRLGRAAGECTTTARAACTGSFLCGTQGAPSSTLLRIPILTLPSGVALRNRRRLLHSGAAARPASCPLLHSRWPLRGSNGSRRYACDSIWFHTCPVSAKKGRHAQRPHLRRQTRACDTPHWNFRRCSRMRKGRSRSSTSSKWAAAMTRKAHNILSGGCASGAQARTVCWAAKLSPQHFPLPSHLPAALSAHLPTALHRRPAHVGHGRGDSCGAQPGRQQA